MVIFADKKSLIYFFVLSLLAAVCQTPIFKGT